jgi:catechol 2,3-dioxygenase-like lactoylglutathione lyase family enzyme
MDITIHAAFLPHNDPDASLAFYRDTLGFEVRNDDGYDGMRWTTVGPADQPGTCRRWSTRRTSAGRPTTCGRSRPRRWCGSAAEVVAAIDPESADGGDVRATVGVERRQPEGVVAGSACPRFLGEVGLQRHADVVPVERGELVEVGQVLRPGFGSSHVSTDDRRRRYSSAGTLECASAQCAWLPDRQPE